MLSEVVNRSEQNPAVTGEWEKRSQTSFLYWSLWRPFSFLLGSFLREVKGQRASSPAAGHLSVCCSRALRQDGWVQSLNLSPYSKRLSLQQQPPAVAYNSAIRYLLLPVSCFHTRSIMGAGINTQGNLLWQFPSSRPRNIWGKNVVLGWQQQH